MYLFFLGFRKYMYRLGNRGLIVYKESKQENKGYDIMPLSGNTLAGMVKRSSNLGAQWSLTRRISTSGIYWPWQG
jgi:hypothetical protein